MILTRRRALFLLAAPAIVRAASLMPISAKMLLQDRDWRNATMDEIYNDISQMIQHLMQQQPDDIGEGPCSTVP
jgi:hypothetical protein